MRNCGRDSTRAEPLDVEVLRDWEEDGVVLKVLRYRIGVFKGQKALIAAVYGYPKGGTKLPGLVQTRDVGDGVIEITYAVHNFSVRADIVFDHLNAPLGGTRVTSLPFHYVSSPEGELTDRQKTRELIIKNGIEVRKTGGWNLSCASEAPGSPSLALVFGRDKHLETELQKVRNGEPHCQFISFNCYFQSCSQS